MFGLDPLYTPERQVTGTEVAVFDTNKGIIKVQLDGKGAPIHVANFCELAESGFYDDTKFHRLVPGFVVQGGDPNTREMSVEDVVFGNPGPDGIPNNAHVDGALAMARSQDPNSAGSQFYFCLGPQHGLDSGYTVFGTTIEGMDVISQLKVGDIVNSIRIENA